MTHFSCLDWLFGMSAETEWTLNFKLSGLTVWTKVVCIDKKKKIRQIVQQPVFILKSVALSFFKG